MNLLVGPIEVFHLLFLTVLAPRPGQQFAILKGGGNLRFFLGSVRYSQDLDFDVPDASVESVTSAMERAVASRPLTDGLRAAGIVISDITTGKQSRTTQRWNVGLEAQLAVPGAPRQPVRTKVEFSGRAESLDYMNEVAISFVRPELTARHALRPPQVRHYLPSAAIVQKLRTLAERAAVQSRDIWDLELLFRQHPALGVRGRLPDGLLATAYDRVFEVDYGAYRNQVVAFLEEEYAPLYDSAAEWARIQLAVAAAIERLRGHG